MKNTRQGKMWALYSLIGVLTAGGLYVMTAGFAFGQVTVTAFANGSNVGFSPCPSGVTFIQWTTGGSATSQNSQTCTSVTSAEWQTHFTALEDGFKMWDSYPSGSVIGIGVISSDFAGLSPLPDSSFTHFISTIPSYGANVATGTVTVGVTGYLTQEDLDRANGRVTLTSVANQVSPPIHSDGAVTTVDLTSAGYFTVTGTSTVNYPAIFNEAFVLSAADHVGYFSFLNSLSPLLFPANGTSTIYAATSTYFAIGMLTTSQQIAFDQTTNRHAYDSGTSSVPYDLSSCSPIATSTGFLGIEFNRYFSVNACVYGLVVPSQAGLQEVINDAESGFLLTAPWGYIGRIVQMFNATSSTSTLPVISYTFPHNFPGFGDVNITFDLWSYVAQASTLINHDFVSNTDQKTVWGIFESPIKVIIALILLFKIFGDIMGLDFHSSSPQNSKVKGSVPDETYRYKEKLYQMSKRK